VIKVPQPVSGVAQIAMRQPENGFAFASPWSAVRLRRPIRNEWFASG